MSAAWTMLMSLWFGIGWTMKSPPFSRILPSPIYSIEAPDRVRSGEKINLTGEVELQSGCYKPLKPVVRIARKSNQIQLFQYVRELDSFCVQMVTYHRQWVEIDPLPSGRFEVIDGFTKELLGTVEVF